MVADNFHKTIISMFELKIIVPKYPHLRFISVRFGSFG